MTALLIAGVAAKEGRESWRGEACCADLPLDPSHAQACDEDGCC